MQSVVFDATQQFSFDFYLTILLLNISNQSNSFFFPSFFSFLYVCKLFFLAQAPLVGARYESIGSPDFATLLSSRKKKSQNPIHLPETKTCNLGYYNRSSEKYCLQMDSSAIHTWSPCNPIAAVDHTHTASNFLLSLAVVALRFCLITSANRVCQPGTSTVNCGPVTVRACVPL